MATSPRTANFDPVAVGELHMGQVEDLLKLQKAAQNITSILDLERDRHFGKRGLLASNVVLVLADVGCVAHLAGGGHVAHHAFFAYLQALALVVEAAAVHSRQFHFPAGFVMQKDVCLDASE